ncbi:MAG: hypothetical protein U5K30_10820 [Acidimicrobiales bacterium]|nr:hypothetical protein [Acidimicrobiales bacterium]
MRVDATIKTYRYLRIGMVGVVFLLAVSVGFERLEVEPACWQTSVSAYYYTPVRAIFVGGLLAIGLCLIVIKGRTWWEDGCLNVAGMLAPVVAVVPTSDVGRCWSQEPIRRPVEVDGDLAAWVVANIDNNIRALLVAGIAGLVVAAVIASVATQDVLAVAQVGQRATRRSLLAAMVFLLVSAAAYAWWDDFGTRAHGIAAAVMFVFLAMAVGGKAWNLRLDPEKTIYVRLYAAIAALMIGSGVVMFPLGGWDHRILVLEATEIALFAAFWLAQTKEHWYEAA